jgi:hypothetical protein
MLRMVPFGDRHIFFRPNSATRASSGDVSRPPFPLLAEGQFAAPPFNGG